MKDRPELDDLLTAEEFVAWYWLKEELIAFCRKYEVSSSGKKLEIQARIEDYLSGRRIDKASARRKAEQTMPRAPALAMPQQFFMDMIIGEGWRCGPALGAFLRAELGGGFRFTAPVRDFIHTGNGKRLGEVAFCWLESAGRKREIPQQLEYNRHFRAYFQDHPGATKADAITAWWVLRGKRK